MARRLSQTLTTTLSSSSSSTSAAASTALLKLFPKSLSSPFLSHSRTHLSTKATLIEVDIDSSSSDAAEIEVLGLKKLEDAIHSIRLTLTASFPNSYVKSHSFHQITAISNEPISKNPIFNTPSPPKSLDFNTVCETLSSYNNDYNRALDFFNWVETNCGFRHNTETYNSMIDILG